MTAYTSTQSGLFNAASTWGGGGFPSVDADAFVVSVGHSVEYNYDNSALANGFAASTVNGTLFASRTAGSYILKMSATLTISTTGTLDRSDGAGGNYPSNCTFEIRTGANITLLSFSGNAVSNGLITQPTHAYCKLVANAGISATVLDVDTDLTGGGDALWANGSLVRICDINQVQETEQYTISSVSSTQIALTSGLTVAKSAGAVLVLVTRNSRFVQTGAVQGTAVNTGTNGVFGEEIRGFTYGLFSCTAPVVNGPVSGNSSGLFSCTAPVVNGPVSGNSSGFNSCTAPVVNGPVSGNTNGLYICTAPVVNGPVSGNTNGLYICTAPVCRNALFSGNTRDINLQWQGSLYNTLLGSATEFLSYNGTNIPIWNYVESIDHDQVPGAFKAWCKGGIVTSVASPVYDASRVRSYKHAPESASSYVFTKTVVIVPPGGSLNVRCYVQKDVSVAWLPRLWIMPADIDPLITGSPSIEVIMTDGLNTWEVLTGSITNSTNAPKPYVVETIAKNGSGNVYFDPVIRISSFVPEMGMAGGMVG